MTSTDASKQEASLPTSTHRPNLPRIDTEPYVKHSSNSGLPKGWKATHDRFIAYLDTHAPLAKDGTIAFREWKRPRYTVEQMICLLKERFVRFRAAVSHPSQAYIAKAKATNVIYGTAVDAAFSQFLPGRSRGVLRSLITGITTTLTCCIIATVSNHGEKAFDFCGHACDTSFVCILVPGRIYEKISSLQGQKGGVENGCVSIFSETRTGDVAQRLTGYIVGEETIALRRHDGRETMTANWFVLL